MQISGKKGHEYYHNQWIETWGQWWDITNTVFRTRHSDIVFCCPRHGTIHRNFSSIQWQITAPCPHCTRDTRGLLNLNGDNKSRCNIPERIAGQSLVGLTKRKATFKFSATPAVKNKPNAKRFGLPKDCYSTGDNPMMALFNRFGRYRGEPALDESIVKLITDNVSQKVKIFSTDVEGIVLGLNENNDGLFRSVNFPFKIEITSHPVKEHIGRGECYRTSDINFSK